MRGLSPNWLLGTETLHLYIRREDYYEDKVEVFVNALEKSTNVDVPLREVSVRPMTGPKEIKALMMKAKKHRGEWGKRMGISDR